MTLAVAAAVLVVLTLGLLAATTLSARAGSRISAPEAHERVKSGQLTLIDVRSRAEWRETGIPAGSKTVTIHNPAGMAGFLTEITAAVDGDKSRPIALICASGGRSARARRYLERRGFTEIYDVSEGMLGRFSNPGWLKRGLPTVPCPTC